MSTDKIDADIDLRQLRGRFDERSSEIYTLTRHLKLIAFAVEARRILNGIEDVSDVNPEFRKLVDAGVEDASRWIEYEDVVGESLMILAGKLKSATTELDLMGRMLLSALEARQSDQAT
jgi:hypothetical protein